MLFLVFNEGYLATGTDTDPVRRDLTAEAIRLAHQIRGAYHLLAAAEDEAGDVYALTCLLALTRCLAGCGIIARCAMSSSPRRHSDPTSRVAY